MNSIETDIVVVGAGLSGTTYAHYAALSGQKVVMLEKRSDPGGCLYTAHLYDDYCTELGAHTFYASYATVIEMIRKLGMEAEIIPQKKMGYKMLVNGEIKSIFSQMDLWNCLKGIFRFSRPKQGKTVKEYYTDVLGEKNYRQLVHPVTSAVICQDSSDVAADLLLKSRPKDKTVPSSFSIKGGLGAFIAKACKTEGINLLCNCEVFSVEKIESGWRVKAAGYEVRAKKLVMAAEAHSSARLMAAVSPALETHLKKLPVKETTAFTIASEKDNFNIKPFAYIISTDPAFRSVVSRDVLPDEKHRGMTVHFVQEKFEDNLPALYKVLGINNSASLRSMSHTFTLPQLGVGHEAWRSTLEEITAGIDNFELLGNYFAGLSIEDCALKGKQAAGA